VLMQRLGAPVDASTIGKKLEGSIGGAINS
jgi:hypothetical protein